MGNNANPTLSSSENYSQYLSEQEKLAELVTFSHPVSEGNVNIQQYE